MCVWSYISWVSHLSHLYCLLSCINSESKAKQYEDEKELEVASMIAESRKEAAGEGGREAKGDDTDRRNMMRIALARRMKRDLLVTEVHCVYLTLSLTLSRTLLLTLYLSYISSPLSRTHSLSHTLSLTFSLSHSLSHTHISLSHTLSLYSRIVFVLPRKSSTPIWTSNCVWFKVYAKRIWIERES